MLTPAQLRAARSILGWTRQDLAKKSGVPAVTIRGFESLGADSKLSTIHKMRRALEAGGVIFLDPTQLEGPGVRLEIKKEGGARYAIDGARKKR